MARTGANMNKPFWTIGRRELFRRSGLLAAFSAAAGRSASAAPAAAAETIGNVYRAIGVRPIINARGTFTIITGSQSLPEVKHAMDEASRSYVQLDELMEGV